MTPANKSTLLVKGTTVAVLSRQVDDFISLTDIAKHKEPDRADQVIQNWMRNRNTVEFLGIWESLNNPDFKPLEFEGFRNRAGLNSFVLTPQQWIESTAAVGLISKSGRYGGTYAHKDIAFEFASWASVEFKLYLIKEFQRLKDEENDRLKLDWNLQRTLSKINYRIHTDAIKDTLIPPSITKSQATAVSNQGAWASRSRSSSSRNTALRSTETPPSFLITDYCSLGTSPPHQPRKPQFGPHPARAATARAPRHAQRHRHHPDAHTPQHQQHEATQIALSSQSKIQNQQSSFGNLLFPQSPISNVPSILRSHHAPLEESAICAKV